LNIFINVKFFLDRPGKTYYLFLLNFDFQSAWLKIFGNLEAHTCAQIYLANSVQRNRVMPKNKNVLTIINFMIHIFNGQSLDRCHTEVVFKHSGLRISFHPTNHLGLQII
jgi:hypothetical protein